MASPPSPRPPNAHSGGGGGAPLSLFLDTDLGTRLALLVARDTTIPRLKSQVAVEHAAAFPDIGPVAVKSFQVHRKGALYQLSESMTVTRAFPRVKAEYFLHVKMAEAAVAVRCCEGTPEIDGRRTSEGHDGINVEKHVRELPAATPEVVNDGLTHGHEGADDAYDVDLTNKDGSKARSSLLLLPSEPCDQSQGGKHVQFVNNAQACTDVTSEQGNSVHVHHGYSNTPIREVINSTAEGSRCPWDGGEKHEETKHHEYNEDSHEGDVAATSNMEKDGKSIYPLDERPTNNNNSKEKKRKKVKKVNSVDMASMDTAGNKEIIGHAENAEQTGIVYAEWEILNVASVGPVSYNGQQGDSDVIENPNGDDKRKRRKRKKRGQSESLKYADPNKDQEKSSEHVQNGDSNPSIVDAITSTAEVAASAETIAEGSFGPWSGGEKHEERKQRKYNEGSHDGDVAPTSNMEKAGKNIDALEEKPTNNNIKKRKKVKKVSAVDIASVDTDGNKEILWHTKNAAKTDKTCVKREILHVPSVRSISDNVQQSDSNVVENPNGDGKPKKKSSQSESLKGGVANQDHTKSSEHVTNGSLVHNTNSAPLNAKQSTQGSVEGVTVGDNMFSESPDIAVANTIDMVLANLTSENQIHLDSNMNALELPASTGNIVGNYAALPLSPKYPEAIHSDAPTRSPSNKKRKGKQLNRLPATIDTSHDSFGMNEDADTKSKESDSLRFSSKTSDLKGVFTGDIVEQDDDKNGSTKRQRKKVKKVSTDKTNQYLDEQVNQVAREDMEGVKASIQTDLVQSPMNDTAKADIKLKESDTSRFSNKTVGSKDVFTGDIVGQDNEKGKTTKRQRKKVKNVPTDKTTQSLLEQGNQAARENMEGVNASVQGDLVHGGSVNDTAMETVAKVQQKGKRASKSQAPRIQETNHSGHTAKDSQDENAISVTGTHDGKHASGYPTELSVVQKDSATLKSPSLNARKERNKHLKTELQSLDSREHDPSADVVRCSDDEDSVTPKSSAEAFEANHCIEAHPASEKINFADYFNSDKMNVRLVSAENIQNNEDEFVVPKNTKSNSGSDEPKESQKSSSQKKAPVSNLLKNIAMSASSDSTESTPQLANRFRLAVRNVPKKGYEHANGKSKKEIRKLGSGAISEKSDEAMDSNVENSADNSSPSANSDFSSTASDVDDDGAMSILQKSLRGLKPREILLGSNTYKKVKQSLAEELADDTVVPDSQPADDL